MNNDIEAALRYMEAMARRMQDDWGVHKMAVIRANLTQGAAIMNELDKGWPTDEDEEIDGADAVEWMGDIVRKMRDNNWY